MHPSYIQDTPHFLRVIDKINQGPKLPLNASLVTLDITGLYQNIPQKDSSDCLKEALEERSDQTIPSDFLLNLMNLIQKSIFF